MNQNKKMSDQEIFIQTYQENGHFIGLVVTNPLGENKYMVYKYLLINPSPKQLGIPREFSKKDKLENYSDFQKYVKETAGAEAVFLNYDSDVICGPCAETLEQLLLKNHIAK